ncbi:hypothetical protein AMTR_s00036p00027560 [Amborella trichopoda]|uniref:Uncharacterized protein n=1 Tax=Amborella trichopoda TaxID=13333 RepID=U5CYN7_AMBTC|nr:hypothetical protein AMTR_s00036p00027560 [Amborella trichopoda]
MHAPPPPPMLPLPPRPPAPAAAYSLPWVVEDPMEKQEQKGFLNAWLTTMVAETPMSTQAAATAVAAAAVYKK